MSYCNAINGEWQRTLIDSSITVFLSCNYKLINTQRMHGWLENNAERRTKSVCVCVFEWLNRIDRPIVAAKVNVIKSFLDVPLQHFFVWEYEYELLGKIDNWHSYGAKFSITVTAGFGDVR